MIFRLPQMNKKVGASPLLKEFLQSSPSLYGIQSNPDKPQREFTVHSRRFTVRQCAVRVTTRAARHQRFRVLPATAAAQEGSILVPLRVMSRKSNLAEYLFRSFAFSPPSHGSSERRAIIPRLRAALEHQQPVLPQEAAERRTVRARTQVV